MFMAMPCTRVLHTCVAASLLLLPSSSTPPSLPHPITPTTLTATLPQLSTECLVSLMPSKMITGSPGSDEGDEGDIETPGISGAASPPNNTAASHASPASAESSPGASGATGATGSLVSGEGGAAEGVAEVAGVEGVAEEEEAAEAAPFGQTLERDKRPYRMNVREVALRESFKG